MSYRPFDPSRTWCDDKNDDDILYFWILVLFEKRLVERVEGILKVESMEVLLKGRFRKRFTFIIW
jgi:hypothetical protein